MNRAQDFTGVEDTVDRYGRANVKSRQSLYQQAPDVKHRQEREHVVAATHIKRGVRIDGAEGDGILRVYSALGRPRRA